MSIPDKPDLSSLRIERDAPVRAASRRPLPWKYIIPVALATAAVIVILMLRGTAAIDVETATATMTYPSQANAVLTANGYVVAQRKAAVASKGTGRLVYLGVEEGDKVRKGDIIARLEDQDVVAALSKAQADLEMARADSQDAVTSLERQKALVASRLASDADYDAARARAGRVLAGIRSARAAVEAARVEVENTRIRAPFDGTVLTKDADVGEVVAPFA